MHTLHPTTLRRLDAVSYVLDTLDRDALENRARLVFDVAQRLVRAMPSDAACNALDLAARALRATYLTEHGATHERRVGASEAIREAARKVLDLVDTRGLR